MAFGLADIVEVLHGVSARAQVAVVSGGIGPTPDDVTRAAMAAFSGSELVEIPGAVENLHVIFGRLGRSISPSNLIQARIPQCARHIPNAGGTAAGFSLEQIGCRFYVLPGVPAEMMQMFRDSVLPELEQLSTCAGMSCDVQVYGLGESVIGELLAEFMGEDKNPEVATQARAGVITVRITAVGEDEDEARRRLAPVQEEVLKRLGPAVFDTQGRSLQAVVAELFLQAGLTLAVAESCTGGEIAARLTDIPGSSGFFIEGGITYSNEAKTRRLGVPEEMIAVHGAVSAEVARAMANGMRKSARVDVALAVTGIAGPGGGTAEKPIGLVYIALADADDTCAEECRFVGNRVKIRSRALKRALNMLRTYLIKRK